MAAVAGDHEIRASAHPPHEVRHEMAERPGLPAFVQGLGLSETQSAPA
jgi:hypothetical protein